MFETNKKKGNKNIIYKVKIKSAFKALSCPSGWKGPGFSGSLQDFSPSPTQYKKKNVCWYINLQLGGERHYDSKASCPRTQHNVWFQKNPYPSPVPPMEGHWRGVKPRNWGWRGITTSSFSRRQARNMKQMNILAL